jgi:alpha-tubulin suppressor-like RCC1 family protein
MDHIRQVFYCLCVPLVAACGGGGGSSAPPAPPAPSVMVTVTPPTASVMVGQLIQLTATITGVMAGPVTWSSSNTTVATVSSTGLVTALTSGQVTMTATNGGSGTAALTTTAGIVFTTVTTGSKHTCGVTPSGVAYCWGNNSSGQLGNGTMTDSMTPVAVSGGLSFSSVSAGGNQTCGVASFDPTSQAGSPMYCWGDNSSGQLGNGTTTNSAVPSLVAGGLVFSDVSVGGKHVCGDAASASAYSAYCWGDNSFGQLGNGTTTNSSFPVPVTPPASDPNLGIFYGGVVLVSAGSSHTCGRANGNDGFVTLATQGCWGDNSFGQLGNGTTTKSTVISTLYTNFEPFLVIAGTHFTCSTNFPAYPTACWGNNAVGQLGNGTTTNSTVPVIIAGAKFASIGLGGMHACGIVSSSTGTPFSFANCWGDNSFGQLGNGTTTNSAAPTPVALDLDFAMVSAGGSHTCAITSNSIPGSPTAGGAVYCWGDNTNGQLGNSWTTSSSVPVNVAGSP